MHSSLPLRAGILKRSSYYNSDYRSGAALIRARRPYLVKNTITGIAIFGFAIGVSLPPLELRTKLSQSLSESFTLTDNYSLRISFRETVAFTLKAVGQETFDDVIVPSDTQVVAPNSSTEAAKSPQIQNQSPKTPTAQANGMRS
ncbi:hypothetical protein AYO20_03272 [Fonsecaea nubica]|uniref:Cytochrome c oxidase assembly factor 3 mitochondrial coiled-coil domain-containing protein n=1 Tax=Fonsecaea nubica TaxID=856822 RepID=A0A178D873_9EURO|nr:hypothetical protein AYO20_03272 [Fonsecaea nubica]OAL37423.1 hypothetical protein AYO20_03272 [Fonsecaea nubica]